MLLKTPNRTEGIGSILNISITTAAAAAASAASAPTIKIRPSMPTGRGRKVELPEGVNGVVLRSKPCPEAVREENEDITSFWAAETSFSSVTVREQEATCPRARYLSFALFFLFVRGWVPPRRG